MKKCEFTYKHYKEIIGLAKKKGYVFSDFFQRQDEKKRIYLRHDVDISLNNALKMAEIEKKEGIKSTYLILLDSSYYNIFQDESVKIIKKINELGHDIGIHCDWRGESKAKIAGNLLKQYKFLKALSFPIKNIVSFHRPSKKIFGEILPEFVNTYEPDFFTKIKYVSDSNRRWREGCFCQFLKKPSYQNFQVLIHPVWWNKKSLSCKKIYTILKKQRIEDLKQNLVADITAYKNFF